MGLNSDVQFKDMFRDPKVYTVYDGQGAQKKLVYLAFNFDDLLKWLVKRTILGDDLNYNVEVSPCLTINRFSE